MNEINKKNSQDTSRNRSQNKKGTKKKWGISEPLLFFKRTSKHAQNQVSKLWHKFERERSLKRVTYFYPFPEN